MPPAGFPFPPPPQVGPIIVTSAANADANGRARDVDRDVVAIFQVGLCVCYKGTNASP